MVSRRKPSENLVLCVTYRREHLAQYLVPGLPVLHHHNFSLKCLSRDSHWKKDHISVTSNKYG